MNTPCGLSESWISDRPVHLKWSHLHIWSLVVLGASCRAVPCWPSHWTEAGGGATVYEARRSRYSRTPQEPARRHQVAVALRVREGIPWTAGAGAADAGATRRRRRHGLGLPHLEHHLKVKMMDQSTETTTQIYSKTKSVSPFFGFFWP